MNYELWGYVVSLAGLVLTGYKIQQSNVHAQKENVKEFQKLADQATNTEIKVETMAKERSKIVSEIYGKIEKLETSHDVENRAVYDAIEKKFEKLNDVIKENHKETQVSLASLTKEVTQICSTFQTYREEHVGNGKTVTRSRKTT